jgi:ribonuclease Z
MKKSLIVTVLVGGTWFAAGVSIAHAAPCLIVALTGTAGGPQQPFNGLASAGTLVRYGEDANNCGAVKLQFDAGRGTTMRLSQLGVGTEQLNAVFFTHMHNDHTEGFADLVQSRWAFHGTGPKIDAVCSSDVVSPQGFTVSCRKFVTHLADAYIQSGEISQRHSEVQDRTAGGPSELINTISFEPKDEPQSVWSSSDVKVSAIRSTHIPGNVSYRVDTPAMIDARSQTGTAPDEQTAMRYPTRASELDHRRLQVPPSPLHDPSPNQLHAGERGERSSRARGA